MKISVIIPAFNEENYLATALQSVFENAPENLLEVIVVNNASTDKTAQVATAFKKVRLVNEPEKGLTRARQAGLNAASGDLIAYIDADTQVTKKWFEILNREFERDAALVCLSGPYNYFDLNKNVRWYEAALFKLYYWFVYNLPRLKGAYIVTGGNFVAKKTALLKIGGFDQSIEFYGEDTDIGRRLRQAGKIKFLKDFEIKASARRLNREGFIQTGLRYLLNYLSIIITKKPALKKYSDIR